MEVYSSDDELDGAYLEQEEELQPAGRAPRVVRK